MTQIVVRVWKGPSSREAFVHMLVSCKACFLDSLVRHCLTIIKKFSLKENVSHNVLYSNNHYDIVLILSKTHPTMFRFLMTTYPTRVNV